MPTAAIPSPRAIDERLNAAFAGGAAATLRRCLPADVVWNQGAGFPVGGSHRGADAVLAAIGPGTTTADEVEFAGVRARILVTGPSTDHGLTARDRRVEARAGAPLHRAAAEHKFFRVLDGHFRFRLGDELRTVSAGDRVQVRAGVAHGFRNSGPTAGGLLLVVSPGHHDAFSRPMAAPPVPQDWSEVQRVAAAHRQQLRPDPVDPEAATDGGAS